MRVNPEEISIRVAYAEACEAASAVREAESNLRLARTKVVEAIARREQWDLLMPNFSAIRRYLRSND